MCIMWNIAVLINVVKEEKVFSREKDFLLKKLKVLITDKKH